MKILQVTPYYVPAYSYGGPVKNSHAIATGLRSLGHSVVAVTTDAHDATSRQKVLDEEIDGIRVIRFRNISNYAAKHFNAYAPIGFRRWCKKHLKEFDVIHCHDFFTWQNIVISYYAKKYNVPYLVQPRGVLSPVRTSEQRSFVKKLFLHLFRGVLLNASAVVATSEHERFYTAEYGVSQDRIPVVWNGIAVDEMQDIEPTDIHKRFGIPGDSAVICYLGRVQWIKGIDITLEALAQVIATGKEAHYLVVGPDEQGEQARLQTIAARLGIAEYVHFTGILTGQDKWNVVAACDLFVCTSRSEGTPMTSIEAAALGLPQVLTTTCPISEVFAPRHAAFAHAPNDVAGIAESIVALLGSLELQRAMGASGRAVVEERLTMRRVVEQFEEVYAKLAAN